MIAANAFSQSEPGVFTPIWDVLLTRGDYYMHLADLSAYVQAPRRGSGPCTGNPRRLGTPGDPQPEPCREVLQRLHHCGIRR